MTAAIRWPTLALSRPLHPKPRPAQVPPPVTRFFAALLLFLAAALGWVVLTRPAEPQREVGLFTSLPILWGENEDLGDLLATDRPPHRVRTALEALGPIRPLDTLERLGPDLKHLIMAQPRPLSPAENVALDDWVRGGGQLLLLADPLLTEHSVHAVGDPRRPQDVVLLSPILTHWGLELSFDEAQPAGLRTVAASGPAIPVDLAGTWRTSNPQCRLEAKALLVACRIGQGQVLALADAEIAAASDAEALRTPALAELLRRAFATS